MTDIPPDVEQALAKMTAGEWSAFTARVRAPDIDEQLKTAVGKHISGSQLDAVLRIANPVAFLDDDGAVDETRVSNLVTRMFGKETPRAAGGPAEAERQRRRLGFSAPAANGAETRHTSTQTPEVQRQLNRLGITQKAGDK